MESDTDITSLEMACRSAEEASQAVSKAAKRLDKAARALEQAARTGDLAKLAKGAGELDSAIGESGEAFMRARRAWPYGERQIAAYLSGPFGDELARTAQGAGLKLSRLDDRWTAFPVVLEVLAKARAVRIDGKRLTSLRPSAIVDQIQKRQAIQGGKPERFIEMLYSAYRALGQTRGVHLQDIYDLLTILPEAKAGYSRADFARDVYLLESSPVRTTKDGKTLSFMGATGVKGSAKVLTVIPPDGMPKHYHAILFSEHT